MKLLAAGSTFGEAKDGPTEFKLKQEFLPKFAPAKRPISLAPVQREAKLSSHSPYGRPVTGMTFSSQRIQLTPCGQNKKEEKTKPEKFSFLGWLFGRLRRSRKGRVPLVQTEWTLEGVKVVRNDLSDTDIIVRAAPPVALTVQKLPAETGFRRPLAWLQRSSKAE